MTARDGGIDPVGNPGSDPRAQLGRLLEEDPADLYENAPMGYLSTLPDGRIVKVNRTFCAWTGRSAEDLIGARFQDLLSIGGQVFHETHLSPLLRMQGAVREIALDVVRVDGSVLPCLLNAVELRDEAGDPVLVRATLFDATARRRYERELLTAQRSAEASEARSRVVQMVVSDLAAAISVRDVAEVIVEHGRGAIRALGAALLLVEEAASGDPESFPRLRIAHADGLSPALLKGLQLAAGTRLALELAEGVRSVPLDEKLRERHPGVAAAMAVAGLSALVTVPVSADNRRLGVLILGTGSGPGDLISLEEPEDAQALTPADVDLLWTIGRQAGQALERARLYEKTARQAERAAFLLEAARMLAGAADVNETVEHLARLAVERLADLCVIDLAGEHGMTRPASRHRDPAAQPLADELKERNSWAGAGSIRACARFARATRSGSALWTTTCSGRSVLTTGSSRWRGRWSW